MLKSLSALASVKIGSNIKLEGNTAGRTGSTSSASDTVTIGSTYAKLKAACSGDKLRIVTLSRHCADPAAIPR